MKAGLWKGATALLFLLNILLLGKIYLHSPGGRTVSPTEYVSRPALPPMLLQDRSGHQQTLQALAHDASATLFVFFSPSDCPPCLEERALWGQVSREGDIPVFGVGTWPSASEFWGWIDRMDLSIPTLLDTTFALADSLGLRAMPLKVLVSRDAVIRWADPARLSAEAAGTFRKDLSRALELFD